VIGVDHRDPMAREEAAQRLGELEAAIGRLPGLSDETRADLAGCVAALHASLEQERRAEHELRHQMSHDLRTPLNAIAGWTHILRLEATTSGTVLRAADVLERNVRALTRLIDAYAGDAGR
jgi:signal transduction histidine kinase